MTEIIYDKGSVWPFRIVDCAEFTRDRYDDERVLIIIIIFIYHMSLLHNPH